MNIRLHRESVTLDTDLLQTFKELEMKCLALWMYSRRRNWLSKTAEFLGGKSANEPMHFLLRFALFNPRGTETIPYTRLNYSLGPLIVL